MRFRLLVSLLSALLLIACETMRARDLPRYLDFWDEPAHFQLLPKDYIQYSVENSPEAEALVPKLQALAESHQISVAFEDLTEYQWFGYYDFTHAHIGIHSGLGSVAKVGSLTHELGHACSKNPEHTQTMAEIVAESIALLALQGLKGVDTVPTSTVYLLYTAPRAVRMAVYQKYSDKIDSCAREIREALK